MFALSLFSFYSIVHNNCIFIYLSIILYIINILSEIALITVCVCVCVGAH